ncbi:hypothetical protein Tco_1078163 [Tanacetum coccineum]
MLGRQIYDENVPLYYHINKDFSIPFGREEFCRVTGLRFGIQNWAEYDTKQRILFRRRVFSLYLDGQPITGDGIANLILDESFAQLYDDDAVGLCCLSILQLVILSVESKRVVPDWMLRLANDRVAWDKSIISGTDREALFRQSCFDWVLDQTDFIENCILIHFMLGRQIYDENDDENVPLYYHINKDFSIPFGREEFCLVTGLRFGVQNWAEYDTKQRIPFRRRVFPSYLDGQPITGNNIANMILDESFAQLYDDDVVGLCCLGILQLVILDEDVAKKYSIFGYTWAFKTWILESYRVTAIRYFDRYNRYPRVAAWNKKKGRFLGTMVIPFFEGNMPAARLTPDDNEARSDWWISSRAYFDGFIGQVERVPFDLSRQNMYEISSDIYREFDEQKREIERNKKEVHDIKEEMRKFREEMKVQSVRQENKEPIIADQHYGLSDFSQFQSMQSGATSRMGRQNLQTTIETHDDVDGIFDQNILNREKREQFPSKYKLTPFTEQPPTTILPKQRVNKTKNKGKKANLSPLNLGGAFEDDNVEENNVTFLGS